MDSDDTPTSRLRSVLIQIAIWCGVGCAITAATTRFNRDMSGDDVAITFLCGTPGFAMVAWIISRPFAMMWRAHKREQLIKRAERYECLNCGYPLKDVARGGICPECGSPPGWVR